MIRKRSQGGQIFRELFQFLFVWQMPCQQQKNSFIKTVPLIFLKTLYNIFNINSPVQQSSRNSNKLVAFLLIANHLSDFCQPDKDTRSISIAQPPLYIIFLK